MRLHWADTINKLEAENERLREALRRSQLALDVLCNDELRELCDAEIAAALDEARAGNEPEYFYGRRDAFEQVRDALSPQEER